MRFTIFTPTYNRGNLLQQLYKSLLRQTFKDFEWIIVDDGSTDNTEEIVKKFQEKKDFFPIIYEKQSNGGKHRAWNRGVELASGELFFGCDSDDYLTDDALEVVDRIERSIPTEEKEKYAGVCGLRGYKDLHAVGKTFTQAEYMDLTHLERLKNNVIGDKSEVFYTAVWKKYKYYEFEGENFLTEATSLNRMAEDGLKIRYFNTVVKIMEYLPDGLTATSKEQFVKNPRGWGLYISQQIKFGMLKGTGKWDVITNYYNQCTDRFTLKQIARNLYINSWILWSGINVTKIRYKLHKKEGN